MGLAHLRDRTDTFESQSLNLLQEVCRDWCCLGSCMRRQEIKLLKIKARQGFSNRVQFYCYMVPRLWRRNYAVPPREPGTEGEDLNNYTIVRTEFHTSGGPLETPVWGCYHHRKKLFLCLRQAFAQRTKNPKTTPAHRWPCSQEAASDDTWKSGKGAHWGERKKLQPSQEQKRSSHQGRSRWRSLVSQIGWSSFL